jgi:hypothetical protein
MFKKIILQNNKTLFINPKEVAAIHIETTEYNVRLQIYLKSASVIETSCDFETLEKIKKIIEEG